MGKANTPGKTDHFISGNLSQALSTGKANGKVGKGLNAISMKEIMHMTRSMVSGFSIGQVEIAIKVSIERTREMALVKWYGLMVVRTKEIGTEVFSMDRARWYSQMGLLKKVSLRWIYIKEVRLSLLPQTINKIDKQKGPTTTLCY
jgi:hypothetical protein